MQYAYAVVFSAIKGCGPDCRMVTVDQAFDDVEPNVPEETVRDWAAAEASLEMSRRGYHRFTLVEINSV